ncbi:MAG: hypothetical protein KatS3mg005_0374 [Bryobacteraceae bacterium]|nr:MAG: hypothetical protein KatS3mg005_0374 [Bryobacteraceae bacterium]
MTLQRKLQRKLTTLGLAILLGAALTHGQAGPDADRRMNAGLQAAGNAVASGAARYHLLLGGSWLPGEGTLAALMDKIEQTRPSNPDEVRAALRAMKIDGGMPNRISMNVSVAKQTQGTTFGERVNAGPPRASAGGGAASAAYAATGRAPREIVILFCDDEQQEQEAIRLIPSQLQALQTKGNESRTIQDQSRGFTSIIRRVNTSGGRQWTWVSGAVKP